MLWSSPEYPPPPPPPPPSFCPPGLLGFKPQTTFVTLTVMIFFFFLIRGGWISRDRIKCLAHNINSSFKLYSAELHHSHSRVFHPFQSSFIPTILISVLRLFLCIIPFDTFLPPPSSLSLSLSLIPRVFLSFFFILKAITVVHGDVLTPPKCHAMPLFLILVFISLLRTI